MKERDARILEYLFMISFMLLSTNQITVCLISTSGYPSVNTLSLQCAIHIAEIMFEDTI